VKKELKPKNEDNSPDHSTKYSSTSLPPANANHSCIEISDE